MKLLKLIALTGLIIILNNSAFAFNYDEFLSTIRENNRKSLTRNDNNFSLFEQKYIVKSQYLGYWEGEVEPGQLILILIQRNNKLKRYFYITKVEGVSIFLEGFAEMTFDLTSYCFLYNLEDYDYLLFYLSSKKESDKTIRVEVNQVFLP